MRWIARGLVTAALAFGVVVPATTASAATELITNGAFSAGTANWWGTGNTPISPDAGQLKAVVPGGTANKWDAMLGQKTPAFALHQGHKYTLAFDARASAARTLVTTVQLNTTPFTGALNQTFSVGTATQRFRYDFTSSLETTQAELTFQLGGLAGGGYNFWLDNVSLTEVDSPPAGSPISLTNGFYVDPHSNPKKWADDNPGGTATTINNAIASKPMARWFGGWNTDLTGDINAYVGPADTADKLPVLVAYNLPGRDACGGHSSGGAAGEAAYKTWIQTFASAIGNRPALVILEPDSIGDLQCITDVNEKNARIRMLSFALLKFKELAPNTWTYADATNKGWGTSIGIAQMAANLNSIGLQNAHGLAVNVSNYYTTAETITYMNDLNNQLATPKPFVIDTSRNGNGPKGSEWCNPAGRKLGSVAQQGGGAEMLLWVKVPGDSDGQCGTSTKPAGTFDPQLALNLINN
ncbi:endoglucanase [Kribbella antibiotica]|uniref:Glucanase n=1 Tax=Kribbella antibiotica TaxID=190195 RepID=A0A4R4ZFW3_9ACTN|nr:glycoside hydrolase family 6 protein [Kribbella antibiotica]TDD57383.1 endoglucanase [Kribbella antibiotica]